MEAGQQRGVRLSTPEVEQTDEVPAVRNATETNGGDKEDGILGKGVVAFDQNTEEGHLVLVVRPRELLWRIPYRRGDRWLLCAEQLLVLMNPIV